VNERTRSRNEVGSGRYRGRSWPTTTEETSSRDSHDGEKVDILVGRGGRRPGGKGEQAESLKGRKGRDGQEISSWPPS